MTLEELLTALPRLRNLGVKKLRFGNVELEFEDASPPEGHAGEIMIPAAAPSAPAAPPRRTAPSSPWAQALKPAVMVRDGHDVDVDPQHGVG